MEYLTYSEKIDLQIILKDRIKKLEHEKSSNLLSQKEYSGLFSEAYTECSNLLIQVIDGEIKKAQNLLDKLVY